MKSYLNNFLRDAATYILWMAAVVILVHPHNPSSGIASGAGFLALYLILRFVKGRKIVESELKSRLTTEGFRAAVWVFVAFMVLGALILVLRDAAYVIVWYEVAVILSALMYLWPLKRTV